MFRYKRWANQSGYTMYNYCRQTGFVQSQRKEGVRKKGRKSFHEILSRIATKLYSLQEEKFNKMQN